MVASCGRFRCISGDDRRGLTRRLQLAGVSPKEEIHLFGGGLGPAAEAQCVRRQHGTVLMNAGTRYDIDDTDRVPPHVRLCHKILRDGLSAGFTAVELAQPSGSFPTARARLKAEWKPFMTFPVAVYTSLVERFKEMAGPNATIPVRLAGRDASVTLNVQRNEQGSEDLVLGFPANPLAEAAV